MSDELVVVWRVTGRCGLTCPFCAFDRSLDYPRRDADPEQVLDFGKILQAERERSGRGVLVSWLGGEPFLWKPLFDVSRVFKHEFGLRVAVTTNGLALKSKAVRERLAADFDQVTVSIDQLNEKHDQLRGAVGLFDGLKSSMEELARLESNLLVRANIVLMRKTIHSFEPLCVELANWGVHEVTFNALGGRDRPEFFPANRLTEDDVTWFASELPRIRDEMARRGLRIQGDDAYLERILALARGVNFQVDDCSPGGQFLFVDENGVTAPCHFTVSGFGVPMREIQDIEALPFMFQALRQRNPLAACMDCKSTQVFGKFNRQPLEVL